MRIGILAVGITLTAALAVGGCHKVEDTTAAPAAPAADPTTDRSPWGAYTDDTAGNIIGIWTDSKTHCQYFLGSNIMTPRLGDDGRPICDASAAVPATASPNTDGSSPN